MNFNTTLDDMIIEYSENPFIDKNQYTHIYTGDRTKKTGILKRLLYMANLLAENKMEEMRKTFRSIQAGI